MTYLTLSHDREHVYSELDAVLDGYQFETHQTMRVGSFDGALDTERQTVFESLIGPTGFHAKATKEIGPSSW